MFYSMTIFLNTLIPLKIRYIQCREYIQYLASNLLWDRFWSTRFRYLRPYLEQLECFDQIQFSENLRSCRIRKMWIFKTGQPDYLCKNHFVKDQISWMNDQKFSCFWYFKNHLRNTIKMLSTVSKISLPRRSSLNLPNPERLMLSDLFKTFFWNLTEGHPYKHLDLSDTCRLGQLDRAMVLNRLYMPLDGQFLEVFFMISNRTFSIPPGVVWLRRR